MARKAYTKKDIKRIKAQIVENLNQNGGIITAACRACGISRQTVLNWREQDADFDKACKDSNTTALDMAESALLMQVKAGNVRAIKFYLQCKGASRGYNPRIQMDMNANVNADRPILVFRGTQKPKEQEE